MNPVRLEFIILFLYSHASFVMSLSMKPRVPCLLMLEFGDASHTSLGEGRRVFFFRWREKDYGCLHGEQFGYKTKFTYCHCLLRTSISEPTSNISLSHQSKYLSSSERFGCVRASEGVWCWLDDGYGMPGQIIINTCASRE